MNELEALAKLLEDEDIEISSMAMERLLKSSDKDLHHFIRTHQENPSIILRQKVHQIENILRRRQSLNELNTRLQNKDVKIWDDLLFLDQIFHPDINIKTILDDYYKFVDKMKKKVSIDEIRSFTKFMKKQGFSCPQDDILDPSLFFPSNYFGDKIASPIIHCIICRKALAELGIHVDIFLHEGQHCLYEKENQHLIKIHQNWRIKKQELKTYSCSDLELFNNNLHQLFLAAVTDGQLRNIQLVSRIITATNELNADALPYPIGQQMKPPHENGA